MTSATSYRFEISRICFIMWTQKFTNYKNVIKRDFLFDILNGVSFKRRTKK